MLFRSTEKAEKKPEPPKKATKLTKQQEKELEEEMKKQQESERLKQEEERLRREEIERNFDAKGELQKLGGNLYEFHEESAKEYSQHYEWIVPCYFSMKTEDGLGDPNVAWIQINTATVKKNLILNREEIDFGEVAVGIRKVRDKRDIL